MLISPQILRLFFGIKPRGVLHVGAHLAEEADSYKRADFGRTIWVEAQVDLASELTRSLNPLDHLVISAVAWSKSGLEMVLDVTSDGQSTSLFKRAQHKVSYPHISVRESRTILTSRLDEVVPVNERFSFVNLDIQGAELEALIGLGDRLSEVDAVYTEVNRTQVYEGIPEVTDLDDYLLEKGFFRVATRWDRANWGDAVYLKPRSRTHLLRASAAGKLLAALDSIRALSLARRRQIKMSARKIRRVLAIVSRRGSN